MILDTIADATRVRIEKNKKEISYSEIQEIAEKLNVEKDFPFEKNLSGEGIHFICEVKKASPSKGIIAEDFPYITIAKEYEEAGASCISVLTEPDFFMGKDSYLREIRKEVAIPLLRKDFILEPYQIYQAKVLGADAILLICALLRKDQIEAYIKLCDSLGLSALVEAHDETEVRKAVEAGARIIGVNNRDLRTFEVDIKTSGRLRALVPESILFIAESGIQTAEDIQTLVENRINGVLIGETLMKSKDKKEMLRKLRGEN